MGVPVGVAGSGVAVMGVMVLLLGVFVGTAFALRLESCGQRTITLTYLVEDLFFACLRSGIVDAFS
jgi:hypothetical protein